MKTIDTISQRRCPLLQVAVSSACMLTASAGLVISTPLGAQTTADEPIETITVTGSRIRSDGYAAPTPVMVLDEDSMEAVMPVSINESLAQLPQFNTSSQPSTAVEYANLRNIGAERTLVLLDGRRHVPTFSSGVVDLTTIPTALVRSTEVVTGGASASWGSDAVAGVLNMILKDDLQGIEGNVQYGENTEYSDDESYNISVAGGTQFADGRGHVLVGVERAEREGIPPYLYPDVSRPWGSRGLVANGDFSGGQPQFIYAEDVRRADVHDGGLITSGPLRGTTFLPDGQTGEFQYGDLYRNNMIGGGSNPFEPPDPGGDVRTPLERTAFFGRASWEFSPTLGGVLEYNYSEAISEGESILGRNQGSIAPNGGCTQTGYSGPRFGNINVSIDNAFLPGSVRDQMVAEGIDCFNFGRTFREEGMGYFNTEEGSPGIHRFVAALDGEFGSGWTWDVYTQYGKSEFQQRRDGNIHSIRFQAAADSVLDAEGAIQCRINVDADAGNDDPACVPFNLFGAGSPSMAAQEYVTGYSRLDMEIEQTVLSGTVQGDLLQLPAGPLSSAFGYEYRKEEIVADVDPASQENLWQTSNRKGIAGDYDVNEIFAEVAVPLVTGAPMAESVDLNMAVRGTDYSTSGNVTTWKLGGTWDINPQVRLRVTQSRDIRAGNLGELFTPTAVDIRNVTNPDTSVTVPVQSITSGNPDLEPEEADTFTAGIVVSPDAISGLQFSVDYYAIEIEGLIDTLSSQEVVDQCYLMDMQEFCDRLTLDNNGVIVGIDNSYANLNEFEISGVDLMASYSRSIGNGDFSVRLMSTYLDTMEVTYLTDGSVEDQAGVFGNPEWKHFLMLRYGLGNFSASIDWRWYDSTILNVNREEGCAGPGCANVNSVDALDYTSLNLGYELPDYNTNLFLRIDNLFDDAPPFPLRGAYNDNQGRGIRAGVRFAF